MKKFIKKFLIPFSLLLFPVAISAHAINDQSIEYMAVQTEMEVSENVIDFSSEMAHALRDDLSQKKDFLKTYYSTLFPIKFRWIAEPCEVEITKAFVEMNPERSVILGRYICQEPIVSLDDLDFASILFYDLIVEYDHFVNVRINGQTEEFVFTEKDAKDLEGASSASQDSFLRVIKRFIVLGFEHIIFGFDHVLFLLAVVFVVTKLKDILLLVTSFTIAHSITLILAGLDVITLTSKIVEPLIAFSIAFVAFKNIRIFEKGIANFKFKERWIFTFGFGLFHGLGFAGALSEIQIPQKHFITSLLTFNVGVELGQIAILIVIMPMLWVLSKKFSKYHALVLQIFSGIILAMSLVWMVDRVS